MPITTDANTINAADGTAGSLALGSAIKSAILANPAWTLEDEFDASTVHYTVLKCSALASGLPVDFRVSLVSQGATFGVMLHEAYNTSSKNASKRAPANYNTGSGRSIDTDFTCVGNIAFSSSIPSGGGGAGIGMLQTTCGTINRYMIVVASDRVHIATLVAGVAKNATFGAFESLVDPASADPVPLAAVSAGGNQTLASYTRMPNNIPNTTTGSIAFELGFITSATLPVSQLVAMVPMVYESPDSVSAGLSGDLARAGKATVSRLLLLDLASSYFMGQAAARALRRGRLKGVRAFAGAVASFGDTVVIDGTVWWIMTTSSDTQTALFAVDTGVAA